MVQQTGVCKYCGQVHVLMVPDSYDQAAVDHEAVMKCMCPEAQNEQRVIDMIACAEAQIKKFFAERNMPLFEEILLKVVEPMAKQDLQRISISAGEYTISMKRKKSSIEVGIKMVTEEKVES